MPDYIDGVYNYCDRWCERCPLTARCRVFVIGGATRSDRGGSAKIALIGIERSLRALTILSRAFPADKPTLRDLFRRLSQLRILVDRRWPGARLFQRPGFDD